MTQTNKTLFAHLLLLLGMVSAWSSASADGHLPDSLLDSWSGNFQVGNYPPLELVFHFSRNDSGSLTASLDIPSQYRTGIPAERATLSGQRLTLYFPAIQAEFMGGLSVNQQSGEVEQITGDWSQSGEFVALRLQRHSSDD